MLPKFKYLLALLVSVLLSHPLLSYELVSQKTTISPGCEGRIVYETSQSGYLEDLLEDSPFLNSLKSSLVKNYDILFDSLNTDEYILSFLSANQEPSATAKAFYAYGIRNSNISISSEHTYFLINNSSYIRYFNLSIGIVNHECKSQIQEHTFFLKPGEYKTGTFKLEFKCLYQKTGKFPVYAYTKISGDFSFEIQDSALVTAK